MPVTLEGGPHDGETAVSPEGTDYTVFIAYSEIGIWGEDALARQAKHSDYTEHVYRWDGKSLEYDETHAPDL
jgi:hypothetical protein